MPNGFGLLGFSRAWKESSRVGTLIPQLRSSAWRGLPPCTYRSGFSVVFLDFRRGTDSFIASPSAEQLRDVEPAVFDRSDPLLLYRVGGSRGVLDWRTAIGASSGVTECPSFLR